jgi:hypothetical protein
MQRFLVSSSVIPLPSVDTLGQRQAPTSNGDNQSLHDFVGDDMTPPAAPHGISVSARSPECDVVAAGTAAICTAPKIPVAFF